MYIPDVLIHDGPPVNEDYFPDGVDASVIEVGRVFSNDEFEVWVGKADLPDEDFPLVVTYVTAQDADATPEEYVRLLTEDAYWTRVHTKEADTP